MRNLDYICEEHNFQCGMWMDYVSHLVKEHEPSGKEILFTFRVLNPFTRRRYDLSYYGTILEFGELLTMLSSYSVGLEFSRESVYSSPAEEILRYERRMAKENEIGRTEELRKACERTTSDTDSAEIQQASHS